MHLHDPQSSFIARFVACGCSVVSAHRRKSGKPTCRGAAARAPCKGWRDLSRTKHAIFKGEKQLDLLFQSSGYHVADALLSEHTACVYKARELPVATLEEKVRAIEYVASCPVCRAQIQGTFDWTSAPCRQALRLWVPAA